MMRFAGYAAVFDRVDRGGDVIRRGAFAGSLGRAVPLLWQHDRRRLAGRIELLAEDAKGLRVVARLDDRRVATGHGLSFGYRTRRSARKGSVRELIELELVEVSLVASPMQPLARVIAVEGSDMGGVKGPPLAPPGSPGGEQMSA